MTPVSPWTWLVLLFFTLVACLHALSLRRVIPWSFRTHMNVMGVLWFLWNTSVVALVVVLPSVTSLPARVRALGMVLVLMGLTVSTWHRLLLGRARFMGGRCFNKQYDTRVEGGLYPYLQNPIYDGIVLAFIGMALWRENTDFLLLALVSFLFFNIFMAWIEGAPPPRHT